jgi:hypothetical protein
VSPVDSELTETGPFWKAKAIIHLDKPNCASRAPDPELMVLFAGRGWPKAGIVNEKHNHKEFREHNSDNTLAVKFPFGSVKLG